MSNGNNYNLKSTGDKFFRFKFFDLNGIFNSRNTNIHYLNKIKSPLTQVGSIF